MPETPEKKLFDIKHILSKTVHGLRIKSKKGGHEKKAGRGFVPLPALHPANSFANG